MAEYYGIVRSNDHELRHYGVRGMKWGVRKARESGNNLRLTYHYLRAKHKLKKLKRDSNWFIHQKKGDLWGKLASSKSAIGKTAAVLTGAHIRKYKHYIEGSTPGDMYKDKKYENFKKEMNQAFKGTKYDPVVKQRAENLKKARRSKKFKQIRNKIMS